MSTSNHSNRKAESRVGIYESKDHNPRRKDASIQTNSHNVNEVAVCSSCGGIFHSDQISLFSEIYTLPEDFELLCPRCAVRFGNEH